MLRGTFASAPLTCSSLEVYEGRSGGFLERSGFKRVVHIPLTHCVLTVLFYRTRMKTLLSTHLHNIKKGQAEKLKEKMLIGSRFSGLRQTQHSLPGLESARL